MRRRAQKNSNCPSSAEIVAKLNERYHPALNKHFNEMGVNAGNGKSPAETKHEAVVAALKGNPKAPDSYLRIVTVLTGDLSPSLSLSLSLPLMHDHLLVILNLTNRKSSSARP